MPSLIGNRPNQVSTNGDLGRLAFMDNLDSFTSKTVMDTDITNIAPSLNLDFANSKVLDPRITFTRASTATFYNGVSSAVAEQNLYLFSQLFTNSNWGINGTTLGSLISAPDGTTTAYPLNEGTSNGYHDLETQPSNSPTVAAGTTYTLSAFAQNVSGTYFVLAVSGSGYAGVCFNISTGAFVSSTNSGNVTYISSSITQVGSSTWYRCSLTFSSTTAQSLTGRLALSNTTTLGAFGLPPTYTGTNNSINIWGAQLEQRSAVTAYTPTTTAAVTNYIPTLSTAAAGVARFDHNPVTGESLGLLIEEQRVNLFLYSEQFDNAYWGKVQSTVSANAAISPDGTLTADAFIVSAGTQTGPLIFRGVSAGQQAISFYVKRGATQWCAILFSDLPKAWFNLATGAVGTIVAGHTASTQDVGNGWYRIILSGTHAGTNVGLYACDANNSTACVSSGGVPNLFIWGAQLEAGSFATSYIPTVASQVTRSPDRPNMTGTNFSSWYNNAEGTLYADYVLNVLSTANTQEVLELDNTAGGNAITVRGNNTAGSTSLTSSTSGASQGFIELAGVTANSVQKTVYAIKLNDSAGTRNGATVVADTTYLIPLGLDRFSIGTRASGFNQINGTIKKIAYYPRRLNNSELVEMTA